MEERTYTFHLFSELLHRRPVDLPESVLQEAQQSFDTLAQQDAPSEIALEDAMIHFGKVAWPYWEAEFELLETYGKEKEKALFAEKLPAGLREKWDAYEQSLTSDVVFDHGEKFEEAFGSEENHQIEEAVVTAKHEAVAYIRDLAAGEKADEYQKLVQRFTEERDAIEEKIKELAAIKDKSDKWDAEIDELVRYFEKGFAELELRPTVERVQEKIDFYNGQIEGLA